VSAGGSDRPVESPNSVAGVCEVERFRPAGADREAPPALLIEVPHGATREAHFEAVRQRLAVDLPDDLVEFFFVNTDVGAPECASRVARAVSDPASDREVRKLLGASVDRAAARPVLVVHSLIPRTFIDCNRIVDLDRPSELTSAVPDYIREPAAVAALRELHDAYQAVAREAYRQVCTNGGTAIQLHTYAPRSIEVERVGADIVSVLRGAYAPDRYEQWERRPDVDLITRTTDGEMLASARLVREVRARYAQGGVPTAENATYRLHPASTAHLHSTRYPGRVLCLELNRDLLAEPFDPFVEMTIGPAKLARMAAPLAAACLAVLGTDDSTFPGGTSTV